MTNRSIQTLYTGPVRVGIPIIKNTFHYLQPWLALHLALYILHTYMRLWWQRKGFMTKKTLPNVRTFISFFCNRKQCKKTTIMVKGFLDSMTVGEAMLRSKTEREWGISSTEGFLHSHGCLYQCGWFERVRSSAIPSHCNNPSLLI